MSQQKEERALDRVYAAATPEQLGKAYSDWAVDYDRDTIALGYSLPFVIAAWVARHVPQGAAPLLDAGCGTGLSGPFLKALGYTALAGLDYSPEMLAHAESRDVYGELKQAELGRTLPWPDDHFAAFLSSGVFTAGHAPSTSFDELVRITRRGGHAIFTVRDLLLERDGFRAAFQRLEQQGRWRLVEESQPFRAFVLAEPDVLVKAFVFEIQ
ncbi:class I SAM-dependent methyltransferase [Mesorhizobium sp. CAU 1741]|uniref:class I SAM-dependent DNA methyltransferase n=1 Tax=Mesorhizobium sp. CAU 1741 TaxID=3140366 RepID=UPI00325A5E60